jgi:hypothetical protein
MPAASRNGIPGCRATHRRGQVMQVTSRSAASRAGGPACRETHFRGRPVQGMCWAAASRVGFRMRGTVALWLAVRH